MANLYTAEDIKLVELNRDSPQARKVAATLGVDLDSKNSSVWVWYNNRNKQYVPKMESSGPVPGTPSHYFSQRNGEAKRARILSLLNKELGRREKAAQSTKKTTRRRTRASVPPPPPVSDIGLDADLFEEEDTATLFAEGVPDPDVPPASSSSRKKAPKQAAKAKRGAARAGTTASRQREDLTPGQIDAMSEQCQQLLMELGYTIELSSEMVEEAISDDDLLSLLERATAQVRKARNNPRSRRNGRRGYRRQSLRMNPGEYGEYHKVVKEPVNNEYIVYERQARTPEGVYETNQVVVGEKRGSQWTLAEAMRGNRIGIMDTEPTERDVYSVLEEYETADPTAAIPPPLQIARLNPRRNRLRFNPRALRRLR